MDHFILTRFNIVMGWSAGEKAREDGWLSHRFDWFEQWTLPSVMQQTSSNFRWLVFFDKQTPEKFLARARNWPKAEIVLVPEPEDERFRWFTFLQTAALEVTRRAKTEWIAQTRLDNDDRIAWDFVELLQTYFREKNEWLAFHNGSIRDEDGKTYRRFYTNNPFATLVERPPKIFTPYCVEHEFITDHAPVREIKSGVIWQTMLHPKNLVNNNTFTKFAEVIPYLEIQNRFSCKYIWRADFLQKIADHIGAKRYLEISVQGSKTFDEVEVENKTRVEPETTDSFFAENEETLDLVFLDGRHFHEEVFRDVMNARNCLSENGVIVLHDCHPRQEEHQLREQPPSTWNGDVWKAVAMLRQEPDVDVATIYPDFGLGVVLNRPNTDIINIPDELTWDTYREQRCNLLRLMSLDALWAWMTGEWPGN